MPQAFAPKIRGLTKQQHEFCNQFFLCDTARQAAIAAGYEERGATDMVKTLMDNPFVRRKLYDMISAREKKALFTAERIAEEYAKIAFGDIRDLYDEQGNLLPIHQLDEATAAMIGGLDVDEMRAMGVTIGLTKKIKLNDKLAALNALARMKGLFVDKQEVTGKEGEPLTITVIKRVVKPNETENS